MRRALLALAAAALALGVAPATADTVRGKILRAEGHISPNCRTVMLKRNDTGALMYFRIAATGLEDGVLAVILTALTTGLDVDITFTPGATTGCGSEPRIEYVSIRAAGT